MQNTNIITRKRAAQILCVSEQTIKNYASKGILSVDRTTKNDRYLESEVMALHDLPEQKETEEIKHNINQLKSELCIQEGAYKEKLKERRAFILSTIGNLDKYKAIVRNTVDIIAGETLTIREKQIIDHILEGRSYDFLEDTYKLTRERIRQIIEKSLRKMKRFQYEADMINAQKQQLKEQQQEIEKLRSALISMQDKTGNKSVKVPELEIDKTTVYPYNQKIDDLCLSVRCYNCLRCANIRTVYDIVNTPKHKFMEFRNFGKKSMNELMSVIKNLGIDWQKN